MRHRFARVAAGLAALALAGCMSFGGGDTYVAGTTSVSKGQELTDLQRALNEGAITQRDYDRVRDKILRRPN